MEPSNVNPDTPFEAKLAASLHPIDGGPLPDAGFSARVMAALPARRRAPAAPWILPVLGGIVGLGLALGNGASVADLFSLLGRARDVLGDPGMVLTVAIGVAGLSVALLWDENEA